MTRKRASWRVPKTFSFAPDDIALLEAQQHRLSLTGRIVSESETIRAALWALEAVSEGDLPTLIRGVERRRPGRRGAGEQEPEE